MANPAWHLAYNRYRLYTCSLARPCWEWSFGKFQTLAADQKDQHTNLHTKKW